MQLRMQLQNKIPSKIFDLLKFGGTYTKTKSSNFKYLMS